MSSDNDKCVAEGACWACCQCENQCKGQCASGCATHLGDYVNVVAGNYKNTVGDRGSKQCLLGTWSADGASACTACAADIDGNGEVNGADLATLLSSWG